jgi:Flp pilus assembly protein TadD
LQELKYGCSLPGAYYNIGLVELLDNNYKAAKEVLNRYLENNEKDPFAHYVLAIALAREGNFEQAKNEIRIAGEIEPEFAKKAQNDLEFRDIY